MSRETQPMKEYTIRWTRGRGAGGQNRNKLENCCNLTHLPTGTTVRVDARDRAESLRNAKRIMAARLADQKVQAENNRKSAERKQKIKPGGQRRVRTYDYSSNRVTDHISGKKASIRDILGKGKLELLR